MDKTEQLINFLKNSKNIVFFTGAGISCASGIPDFRSDNGIYNQSSGSRYTPEEIISHSFFCRYPEEFYKFYRSKMIYPNARPNEAHLFIASLQKSKNVTVITQNIDGLHTLAGSKNVVELHGSIYRNYCADCHRFYTLEEIMKSRSAPICGHCGGIIKPDVVLYEESLDPCVIDSAIDALQNADMLVIIGTSLTVYPAASFIGYYKGKKMVLINKQSTNWDNKVDLIFNEDVVDVIRRIHSIEDI